MNTVYENQLSKDFSNDFPSNTLIVHHFNPSVQTNWNIQKARVVEKTFDFSRLGIALHQVLWYNVGDSSKPRGG